MHMEHDENMGGYFPLASRKGYIRTHCAQIFWGEKKKEKKTRHHRTTEKHCLKQIAWHKQQPHPRLSLLKPLGSWFYQNLIKQH